MNPIINQIAPIIVIVIALIFTSLRWKTTHFECPNCGSKFKVSRLKYGLTPHSFGRRYVTCPNCNYSAMMASISDKE